MEAKVVKGYENYLIYNNGEIFSKITNKFLTPKKDKYGYLIYHTRKGIQEYISGHRLVAMAFIPNPENLPQVNHINGNKQDNRVENLEWCTASYNSQHRCRILNKKPILYGHKKVKVTNIVTKECFYFNSETEAAKFFNISQTTVSKKILKNHITTKGKTKNLLFEFVNAESVTTIPSGVGDE